MSHVVLKIHAAWHVSDRISLRPRWAAVLGSFNSSTLSGRQPHTPKRPSLPKGGSSYTARSRSDHVDADAALALPGPGRPRANMN